jgi:tripartite-type tricarboxylate transporter receptor subunit TctC
MKFTFLKTSLATILLSICAAAPVGAQQTDWPTHAVNIVVPFPPGGPTDLIARVLARQLTEQLGQTFVVDNKAGANGNIGGQAVASAKPDGYTMLYNTSSLALSPSLYKNLSYNPQIDLSTVTTTAVVPLVLVVNNKLPVNTIQEFIAYAQNNPGKLTYGSAGNGNITQLGAFLINQATGIDAIHVPYRGSSPAMIDLIGGQIQYSTNTFNDSIQFIRDNRVKALAITSPKRSRVFPDLPTVDETILPGFNMGAWQGIVVPAGMDPAIIKKMNTEILKALQSPAVLKSLDEQGAQALGSTPEQYKEYLASEIKRFAEVIRAAGVTME